MVAMRITEEQIRSAHKALKNENGARLGLPSGETVDTTAMGLGPMHPMSSLYRSAI